MNALVAYFSATGTTARAARELAEAIGADLLEIEPEEPYTAADLDWNDKNSRSSREMADETSRPAISRRTADMGRYDTVFLGFPIWWYVEPRIVDTFLESYDFVGKRIVPLATSGGSGLGRAPERMAALAPGATVTKGRLLNGSLNADDLRAWAEGIAR